MCVAGEIDEEVAEEAIDEPVGDPARAGFGYLCEGEFEFCEGVSATFIDSGGLAGGADEEAGEEVREGGMVVPEGNEAAEEIGSAEEGAVAGRGGSEDKVIPATGTGMASIALKFFGTESAVASIFVDAGGDVFEFFPAGGWLDIDFDDARIRGYFQEADAGILRREVAFEDNGELKLFCSVFDGGNEVEVIFECADGGHEHVESSVAWFDAEGGANDGAGEFGAAWIIVG
ncbi:MAG: hypothetical protein RL215_2535 [Planctomycetota bacterium]